MYLIWIQPVLQVHVFLAQQGHAFQERLRDSPEEDPNWGADQSAMDDDECERIPLDHPDRKEVLRDTPICTVLEGNVFTGVFFHDLEGVGTITCWSHTGTPRHTVPTSGQTLPPDSGIWWSSLETCSNLFTWGDALSTSTDIYWPPKTRKVGKWVVRILLECFSLIIMDITGDENCALCIQ